MTGSGGPAPEGPIQGEVKISKPIGSTEAPIDPKREAREEAQATKRAQKERKRDQKRLKRIYAGKPALTALERVAESLSQRLDLKRGMRSLADNVASMTSFLRETGEPIYEEGEGMYDGPLSKRLERFITPQKLAENAGVYPELARKLREEEQEQVNRIRDVLVNIPLVHAAYRDIEDVHQPILPAREVPDSPLTRKNTLHLDQDLGLDEYVFAHWGFPVVGGYGGNILLIDAHILLDPHTIATPSDIVDYARGGMDKRYSQLTGDKRRSIQRNYFNRMISGERWLELTARQIYFEYQQAKAEGRPYMFVQGEKQHMGEIKFHGILPGGSVMDHISRRDDSMAQHWKFLYQHGFAYGHTEKARLEKQQTGQSAH